MRPLPRPYLLGCTLLLLAAAARADGPGDLAAQARALVEQWQKAQNDGDFNAYGALYAARFNGVRRSGARTVRLDRAGWMKDRGRMFKKTMEVSIEALEIAAAPTSARVVFVQRFKQGRYEDRGPKQLVIVPEPGGARIAREEMLSSEMVGAAGPAAARDPRTLAFVSDDAVTDNGVVLSTAPEAAWGQGRRGVKLGDPVVVTQAVEPKRLPPEIAAWLGRPLKLYSGNGGAACETQVVGFKLVARVTPYFGTREEWEKKRRAAVADEAWEMAAGGRILVGQLAKPCPGALFARDAGLAAPAMAVVENLEGQAKAEAVAALRALPQWKAEQASFLSEDNGGTGSWDESDGPVRAQRFQIAAKGATRSFVSVRARAGGGLRRLQCRSVGPLGARRRQAGPAQSPWKSRRHPPPGRRRRR